MTVPEDTSSPAAPYIIDGIGGPTVWYGEPDDPYPLHILARYELPGTTEVRDRVWAALTGHLPVRAEQTLEAGQ